MKYFIPFRCIWSYQRLVKKMNRCQRYFAEHKKINKIFKSGNYEEFLTMDRIDFRILICNGFVRLIFSEAPFHVQVHIINHGVNINYIGSSDFSFVQYAFRNLSDKLLEIVIAKGKNFINLRTSRNFPNLDTEIDDGYLIHYAMTHRSDIIVLLMIDAGVNIYASSKSNLQPIHIACSKRNVEIVKLLLDNGADINSALNHDKPVHFAASNSDSRVIKLLFEKGANINESNGYGTKPIHIACRNHNLSVLEFLINDGGVSVDEPHVHGFGPIHIVCEFNHLHMLEFLIKKGANIESQNSCGRRPIHLACMNNESMQVSMLMLAGADLEAVDIYGNRPIHLICRTTNTIGLKILISSKVNLECANNEGKRPLHIACEYSNIEMIKLLLEAKVDTEGLDLIGRKPIFYTALNKSYGSQINSYMENIVTKMNSISFE